ncbi:MAG: hypothetical protein HYY63_00800, partial [Elusimicrobia bacterium]|nr:hypothetical protein [Elusimicrobiota bacterium]
MKRLVSRERNTAIRVLLHLNELRSQGEILTLEKVRTIATILSFETVRGDVQEFILQFAGFTLAEARAIQINAEKTGEMGDFMPTEVLAQNELVAEMTRSIWWNTVGTAMKQASRHHTRFRGNDGRLKVFQKNLLAMLVGSTPKTVGKRMRDMIRVVADGQLRPILIKPSSQRLMAGVGDMLEATPWWRGIERGRLIRWIARKNGELGAVETAQKLENARQKEITLLEVEETSREIEIPERRVRAVVLGFRGKEERDLTHLSARITQY